MSSSVEFLTADAFFGSREEWNALAAATAHPLPFMTHEWLGTWWKHFGRGQELLALVRREGGSWHAAMPLAVRSVRFAGMRLRVAEIVGTGPVPTRGMGLADKVDLLVHQDHPAAGADLLEALPRLLERVDLVDLKGLDRDSPAIVAVADDRSFRLLDRSVSPYLALPATWEGYLDSRSGNFKKHLRKYWRNLEAKGTLEVVTLGREDDPTHWMEQVFPVNDRSWKGERGTNLFRHPELRAFFLDLVTAMAERGWIDLRVMRVDGRAMAYELCFDYGGRLFSYNSGFDRAFARLSPGSALTANVLEAACERGCTEYDMLRGEEAYKTRWSSTTRAESRLLISSGSLLAGLYLRLGILFKERLKKSERLRDFDDRISGWFSRRRH